MRPLTSLRRSGDAYSFFVGLMKFVLPAAAFLLITLVLMWPRLKETGEGVVQSIASTLTTADIENVQIVRPRYTGVDESNRPFMLTADLARQDSPDADLISLQAPKADITLEDGAWLAMTAESGAYYQRDKVLHLNGAVSLFHDGGYSVVTEEARVDFAAGTAEGNRPVLGEGPLGTLSAQGFRVIDKGEVLIFTGRARLVIHTEDEGLQNFMRSPKEPASEPSSEKAGEATGR